MYGLTPVDRGEKSLFRYLDRMEQSLWGNLADEFTRFRTDIIEDEKEFTLQAELPGFEKKGHSTGCRRRISDHPGRPSNGPRTEGSEFYTPGAEIWLLVSQL